MNTKHVTAMSIKMTAKVTSYEDGQLCGILDSIYFKEPFGFHGMVDMIEIMETAFDALGFPDKALLPRSFGKAKERVRSGTVDIEELVRERRRGKAEPGNAEIGMQNAEITTGAADASAHATTSSTEPIATFEIFVNFRLNAEWQGRLRWVDKDVTKEFSSIVDMTRMLDEALSQ